MNKLALLACMMVVIPGVILAESKTQSIQLEFESEVFARQGNAVVTQADFDAYLDARVPEEDRKEVLSSADRIGQLLENIMLTRLIAADGIDKGILDDPDVQAAAYQAVMRAIADKQRAAYWEGEKLDDYTSQAQEHYILNKERYQTEETIDFKHLLIATTDRSSSEALDLANELKDRIDAGEDLDDLIREYSEDPTVDRNDGFFQDVKREELDEEFADAVFGLTPEEVAGPVASQYGWHIVRLDALNEPEQKDFEEVRDELERRARQQHRSRAMDRYMARLVGARLEIADGAVEKLLDRHGASLPSGERVTTD